MIRRTAKNDYLTPVKHVVGDTKAHHHYNLKGINKNSKNTKQKQTKNAANKHSSPLHLKDNKQNWKNKNKKKPQVTLKHKSSIKVDEPWKHRTLFEIKIQGRYQAGGGTVDTYLWPRTAFA